MSSVFTRSNPAFNASASSTSVAIDLVVVDVSFISLKLILPPLIDIIAPDGEIVALVKPQFEVGAEKLPRDGVVKSDADRDVVLADIRAFVESETPWTMADEMKSPIKGDKRNVEFLVHLT
jgi:23S rRNA (cytidine1920-2'-O)/16S rRNA (cytidine1409-2'-O)-methyltransferase